jgi:hypothetical protein
MIYEHAYIHAYTHTYIHTYKKMDASVSISCVYLVSDSSDQARVLSSKFSSSQQGAGLFTIKLSSRCFKTDSMPDLPLYHVPS